MSFDLRSLQDAVAKHGEVSRVVVTNVLGSAPREAGASMLVWRGGQSGTIGGGQLEWQAAIDARLKRDWFRQIPLGPDLGQCCGGSVALLAERFTQENIPAADSQYLVRRVSGTAAIPLRLRRSLSNFRNSGQPIKATLCDGWFLEPIFAPTRALWIYGAGHVGRAIIDVLAPMEIFDITWVDTRDARFQRIPRGVTKLVAANPADVTQYAPANAEHLILTYSHALDLELCHKLLGHSFANVGLIGSKTKWARFRTRLRALGHTDAQISRISCPIGRPELGKHPQAIAVGVAATLLSPAGIQESNSDMAGVTEWTGRY